MLTHLTVNNLVLIKKCAISFSVNLTTITGETGAGKTTILQALRLLLGGKLDTGLIRSGEKTATVCATFSLSQKQMKTLEIEAGVHLEEETIVLSREISIEGRSRGFFNGESVSLAYLQNISRFLLQIVDQNSYHELKKNHAAQELLDTYGSLHSNRKAVSSLFAEVEELKNTQDHLFKLCQEKEDQLPFLKEEAKKIQKALALLEEEKSLFEEYTVAANSKELLLASEELSSHLGNGFLSSIIKCKQLALSLASTHKLFQEVGSLLEEATCALQEAERVLASSGSLFDVHPIRIASLEESLSLIDLIKKKYGPSKEQLLVCLQGMKTKIATFEEAELALMEGERKLLSLQERLWIEAKALSEERAKSARELEVKISQELQDLNMIGAKVSIQLKEKPISADGIDEVSLFLQANHGEDLAEARFASSGGELSRLLFAFTLHLAEKKQAGTIVFDEIDANVGGTTARLLGEKLQSLARKKQVICITHFPQVAKFGDEHIKVEKVIEKERTSTEIRSLSRKERELELLRMLGGNPLLDYPPRENELTNA